MLTSFLNYTIATMSALVALIVLIIQPYNAASSNLDFLPNYHSSVMYDHHSHIPASCAQKCQHSYGCLGISKGKGSTCALYKDGANSNTKPRLTSYHSNFGPFDATAAAPIYRPCFHEDAICVACNDHPTEWAAEILPGYTLRITGNCSGQGNDPFTGTISLPVDDIRIAVAKWKPPSCPALVLNQTYMSTYTLKNMDIHCPDYSSAAITVAKTESIKIIADTITTTADTAFVIVGGNIGTPSYFSTDISDSSWIDVRSKNDVILAAVNVLGSATVKNPNVGTGIVAVQQATASGYTFWDLDQQTVKFFNVSKYTAVFGAAYEVSFFHPGAFEENTETAALKSFLTYQSILIAFLIVLLLVLHQDIFYYVSQNEK